MPAVGGRQQGLVPEVKERLPFLEAAPAPAGSPLHLQNLVQAKCSAQVRSQTGNSFRSLPWLPPSSRSFPEVLPDPEQLEPS